MPASIPARVTTGPSGSTAATAAAALNNLRDLAGQALGFWPRTSVTIASGVAAPWTATGDTITAGAVIRVDTEGGASTDDLDRLDPTGLLDTSAATACRLVLLSTVSAARVVTVRHAQGGVGEIRTVDGLNWALRDPAQVLVLLWDPTASPRCWRVLGALAAPVRQSFATPTRLPSWSTAGRPTSPGAGEIGLNTTVGRPEIYGGSAWLPLLADPDWSGTAALGSGSTTYSMSTGLGALPRLAVVELECTTDGEYGYAVGDRVPIAHARSGDGSPALVAAVRASTIVVAQRVSVRLIRLDTPGNDAALTPSRWRLRAAAWR